MARALCTPQFAAISFNLLRVLRGTLGTDLPHGQLRDRSRRAGNGCRDRVRRGGRRIAQRPLIGGLAADRIGAKRMIVFGLALQALSVSLYVFTRDLASFYGLALMFGFSYGAVMPLYAILVREYFGARILHIRDTSLCLTPFPPSALAAISAVKRDN